MQFQFVSSKKYRQVEQDISVSFSELYAIYWGSLATL